MPPSRDTIDRIQRLRELFLDEARGDAALRDYWRSDADLEAYARVLAARIGWKWDAALAECRDRGFARADDATVLDFGCGSGVAAERFVQHFGAREVWCHDRSGKAMAFAAAAIAAANPGVRAVPRQDVATARPDVLLVSHVLGELDDAGREALRALIERSRRVVLLEPGNFATSRRLGALRAQLLPLFRVVAPCPHAAACPSLASAGDWCHFFATPPPRVFTDGEWATTARQLGIDLRALPYSFVALERADADAALPAAPPHRVLGRAEVRRHDARLQLCTEPGLTTAVVTKRADAATWRALKKHPEALRQLPEPPAAGTPQ